jgi:hypothetical protein
LADLLPDASAIPVANVVPRVERSSRAVFGAVVPNR